MKLKILSFNIHKGFNWNNTTPTLKALKAFLEIENPDLVFLQEIVGENKIFDKKFSSHMSNQLEYLADSLWHEFAYAKNAVYDGRHHGNAILSKFPICFQKQINISTNRFEQRGILHCDIEINNKILHCLNVHLNLTHIGRKKQYSMLNDYIKEVNTDDNPVIVAGDFNDWNKKASNFLNSELQEAFICTNNAYAKSFPVNFPLFSLDRIYTKGIHITKTEVKSCELSKGLSDHLPIVAEGNIL